jgi:hypothetical protein
MRRCVSDPIVISSRGVSLYDVAARYGVSIKDLYRLNPQFQAGSTNGRVIDVKAEQTRYENGQKGRDGDYLGVGEKINLPDSAPRYEPTNFYKADLSHARRRHVLEFVRGEMTKAGLKAADTMDRDRFIALAQKADPKLTSQQARELFNETGDAQHKYAIWKDKVLAGEVTTALAEDALIAVEESSAKVDKQAKQVMKDLDRIEGNLNNLKKQVQDNGARIDQTLAPIKAEEKANDDWNLRNRAINPDGSLKPWAKTGRDMFKTSSERLEWARKASEAGVDPKEIFTSQAEATAFEADQAMRKVEGKYDGWIGSFSDALADALPGVTSTLDARKQVNDLTSVAFSRSSDPAVVARQNALNAGTSNEAKAVQAKIDEADKHVGRTQTGVEVTAVVAVGAATGGTGLLAATAITTGTTIGMHALDDATNTGDTYGWDGVANDVKFGALGAVGGRVLGAFAKAPVAKAAISSTDELAAAGNAVDDVAGAARNGLDDAVENLTTEGAEQSGKTAGNGAGKQAAEELAESAPKKTAKELAQEKQERSLLGRWDKLVDKGVERTNTAFNISKSPLIKPAANVVDDVANATDEVVSVADDAVKTTDDVVKTADDAAGAADDAAGAADDAAGAVDDVAENTASTSRSARQVVNESWDDFKLSWKNGEGAKYVYKPGDLPYVPNARFNPQYGLANMPQLVGEGLKIVPRIVANPTGVIQRLATPGVEFTRALSAKVYHPLRDMVTDLVMEPGKQTMVRLGQTFAETSVGKVVVNGGNRISSFSGSVAKTLVTKYEGTLLQQGVGNLQSRTAAAGHQFAGDFSTAVKGTAEVAKGVGNFFNRVSGAAIGLGIADSWASGGPELIPNNEFARAQYNMKRTSENLTWRSPHWPVSVTLGWDTSLAIARLPEPLGTGAMPGADWNESKGRARGLMNSSISATELLVGFTVGGREINYSGAISMSPLRYMWNQLAYNNYDGVKSPGYAEHSVKTFGGITPYSIQFAGKFNLGPAAIYLDRANSLSTLYTFASDPKVATEYGAAALGQQGGRMTAASKGNFIAIPNTALTKNTAYDADNAPPFWTWYRNFWDPQPAETYTPEEH